MGGIFGKNKRPCVFPRVVYKARGRKPVRTPRVFCDASTWTEENHFYSARIGRTPRGPEPSAAKVVLESESKQETAEPTAPLRARHALSGAAGDAQGVEVSQEAETELPTEVMQHQELSEEAQQAQSGWSLQDSSGRGDVLCLAGSCEDHEVPPLTQTTVEVDVHVSADPQGGPGEVQAAPAESELLAGAEQEAGAGCASEEACVGKAYWEEPMQEAGDSPAAPGAVEESGLPLEAAETREGITNGQGSAEDAKAPPDLQLGQDTEVPITEGVKENAFEAEQAEEMAEVCEHGQTSKAGTRTAVQEEEKIQVSSGGEPQEH
ncbi:hypothetical protein WISP_67367 [Willisornis vidua]|uniref:Uncharacterized protein n=1 Tax=Willisornis vidua TaxID=1566151 RepID=A0ABQ9DDA3_9PASS|nr:hypothetical protein WISP_67367 [Willisornis vidua]